jgi:tyrosinase
VRRITVQVHVKPTVTQAQIKLRQNVTQLSADDLTRFREAMKAFIARPDNKGFQYFANWHGVAFGLCKHHEELFLPWHRGYLYHFELALQDIDAEVTLPWWNWMDEAGLPVPYEDAPAGGEANVLAGAPIEPWGVKPQEGWPAHTSRDPGEAPEPGVPAPWPPPLRTTTIAGKQVNLYDWMMQPPTYREFMQRCWRLHDNIHVWVGGTMDDERFAAYDPIFWAHHAMVDRLWRIWQHNHPSALLDQGTLETSLTFATAPSLKVSEVLDVVKLGYDYAGQAASAEGSS